jgi:hypothetical protein
MSFPLSFFLVMFWIFVQSTPYNWVRIIFVQSTPPIQL